jgi:regulator of RNase E activity RraA
MLARGPLMRPIPAVRGASRPNHTGRGEFSVGGVLVRPSAVVADGVVVVPREHAEAVARAARAVLEADKATRWRLYEQPGLSPDPTVALPKP